MERITSGLTSIFHSHSHSRDLATHVSASVSSLAMRHVLGLSLSASIFLIHCTPPESPTHTTFITEGDTWCFSVEVGSVPTLRNAVVSADIVVVAVSVAGDASMVCYDIGHFPIASLVADPAC